MALLAAFCEIPMLNQMRRRVLNAFLSQNHPFKFGEDGHMAMPQILRGNKWDTATLCGDNEREIVSFVPTQAPEDPPERLDKTLPEKRFLYRLSKKNLHAWTGCVTAKSKKKKKMSQSGCPDCDVGTSDAAANSRDVFRSGVPRQPSPYQLLFLRRSHLSFCQCAEQGPRHAIHSITSKRLQNPDRVSNPSPKTRTCERKLFLPRTETAFANFFTTASWILIPNWFLQEICEIWRQIVWVVPLLLHIPLCMRIIAQAVPVSLCHIFVLEPVQDCTEEQIMQVPVLQIIEILRNHMPVLYVAFRLRRPRSPWKFPTCKLSLVLCSGTSVKPTGRPRRDTHTGRMLKVWCWPRSVSRRSWPWHKKPYLSGAESRDGPWSCRELGNPVLVVRCQPNVTCAHMGAFVWLLLPRRDRFSSSYGSTFLSSPWGMSLSRSSFSLVLPLSFLIACWRPFSPACHGRGRRHRRGCASFTVTPWSISLTYPLHSFRKICLRVQLVPQERTSLRTVEQITSTSSKISIKVTFQARMLQCTVVQIVHMPVDSSWK